MDLKKFQPRNKGILKQEEKQQKKRGPAVKQLGIRFTTEELDKLQKIADEAGLDKLGTTVKMLLRRGGHI